MDSLERIDDDLRDRDVEFVRCDTLGVDRKYGFSGAMPMLAYFRHGVPILYHVRFKIFFSCV